MKRRKSQEKEVLSYPSCHTKKVEAKVELLNLNSSQAKLQVNQILIIKIKLKLFQNRTINCKKVWLKCSESTNRMNQNQLLAIFLKHLKISLICLSMNSWVLRYLWPVQIPKLKRVIESKLKIKHFQVPRVLL